MGPRLLPSFPATPLTCPPSPPPPAHPPSRRQLEERCRELDLTDLQPFFASAAFREAGFRLADDQQAVLLARA